MSKIKPSLPKGVRDFSPEMVRKRRFIIDVIQGVFEGFGYLPLETPCMENLETLTGKYGEEGDRLLFKILNSGDYLSKADGATLDARDSRKLTSSISKKGLRYDLTVPLARFVAMNSHELAFPFKRYQVQPVWRADRPQKGRYQEFYQCDADVLGSTSLLHEVEFIQMYQQAFEKLGVQVDIKFNNRKVLAGIAEVAGVLDRMAEMTIAIDKLDKAGKEGVRKELEKREFTEDQISAIGKMVYADSLEVLDEQFIKSETGRKGLEEVRFVQQKAAQLGVSSLKIEISLARGLDYYTGGIFEVTSPQSDIGSLGGGGRYDDLTGVFGLNDISGCGISFGLERVYDVMEENDLFPAEVGISTKLLFCPMDDAALDFAFASLQEVRAAGIPAEVYPEAVKMQKQLKYADRKHIPWVAVIGSSELEQQRFALKQMATGEQSSVDLKELIAQTTN